MKTVKFLVFGILTLVISNTQAQVSVNVNIGTPPVWAPADRVEVQYYYLPEIDAYYDVPAERFIYVSHGKWIRARALPSRWSGYNLRGGRVVYLTDYRGNSPFLYHKQHKVKYYTTAYRQPRKVVYVNDRKHKGRGHGHGHGHGHRH